MIVLDVQFEHGEREPYVVPEPFALGKAVSLVHLHRGHMAHGRRQRDGRYVTCSGVVQQGRHQGPADSVFLVRGVDGHSLEIGGTIQCGF
jgi:hypothetical protein